MASLLRPAARVATRAISRTTPVRAFVFSRGLPIAHRAVYRRWNSTSATPPALDTNTSQQQEQPTGTQTQEPRLSITFTCTANDCGHRSSHEFTKRAYTTGIVIVQCPSCKNRHLIADHKGWFKETDGTGGGKLKTIEDLVRAKGERVDRGRIDVKTSTIEYFDDPTDAPDSKPSQ